MTLNPKRIDSLTLQWSHKNVLQKILGHFHNTKLFPFLLTLGKCVPGRTGLYSSMGVEGQDKFPKFFGLTYWYWEENDDQDWSTGIC